MTPAGVPHGWRWCGRCGQSHNPDSLPRLARTPVVPAKYETGQMATLAEGDWNGDMVYNSSDFVTAFTGQGYEQGSRDGGLQTVPEPATFALVLIGFLGLLGIRRK